MNFKLIATLITLILSTNSFAQSEKCINEAKSIYDFNRVSLTPDSNFSYIYETHICYNYDPNTGTSTVEPIDLFWIPGEKLSKRVRKKIEKRFALRLIELRGKEVYSDVLSHLHSLAKDQFNQGLVRLLEAAGVLKKNYDANKAKKAILDTVLDVFIRHYSVKKIKDAHALIVFALFRGIDHKVIDPSISLFSTAETLIEILGSPKSYNEKYNSLKIVLEKISLKVI